MGLLDEIQEKQRMKGLLDYVAVNAGGGGDGFGGRVGLNGLPISDNVSASVGVSGYYLPQYHEGQFNTYDAALRALFGKNKQHELGLGAERINTPDPRYMLNYQYKF